MNATVDNAKVNLYYVPVVSYFDKRANITPEALGTSKVALLSRDKELLHNFVGPKAIYCESREELLRASQKDNLVILMRWNEVTPDLKTLSYNGHYLWERDELSRYELRTETTVSEAEATEWRFDPEKIVKVNFLGDVMLSRHVATQMNRYGYDYPWRKVSREIADADITFANLEVPISDRYQVPSAGMSFMASTKNLAYLKSAGIDVLSVANNHSANFGSQAFTDNIKNLEQSKFKVCGGGQDEAAARKAATITVRGTTFSFLCQSAIVGSQYASTAQAGVPYLALEPWYRDDPSSLKKLVGDIQAAQQNEAVVIDSPHWGVEYKHQSNSSQVAAAHQMINAGADLVIGTHPHVVQAAEYYNDRYILYSLGNFIFDQEWSAATKQGVMASAYFYGTRNVSVKLSPLEIKNYAQPYFTGELKSAEIMADIENDALGF